MRSLHLVAVLVGLVATPALAQEGEVPALANRDAKADARKHCLIEWPDDPRMQEYCEGQAVEGMREFVRSYREFGSSIEKVLEHCMTDWTRDGLPDWAMIGYCSRQQADSMRRRQY